MKIYTASKTKHAEKWRRLRQFHTITASWMDEVDKKRAADFAGLATRCVTEIADADFLLLYCEPGEHLKGALIEAGIALALQKPIRCVGKCESLSRVFVKHPLWRQFATIE